MIGVKLISVALEEIVMQKKTSRLYAGIAALLFCAACSVPENAPEKRPPAAAETSAETPALAGISGTAVSTEAALTAPDEVSRALEEIAELERSGGFVPGLGLAESNLRESSGDYAGAVLAVYKELSWAYGRGEGGVTRKPSPPDLAACWNLTPVRARPRRPGRFWLFLKAAGKKPGP